MEPILNIARDAALKAGDVIVRNLDKLDRIAVTNKNVNDFVTEVDVRAEEMIIETIRQAYPSHGILAEESGEQTGDDTVWIIDPLDGTKNYLHGFPHFAVSIGVQIKGKLEYALIYQPLTKEIFSAKRGSGARLNDRRIRVSKCTQLTQALIGTGFPFRDKKNLEPYLSTFSALFKQASGIRRAGAAALDLAYVAAGRLDGFWEFNLKPWDLAAGILLIREAGGLICDPHGGDDYFKSGNIVAGNPKICKSLLQHLHPLVSSNSH